MKEPMQRTLERALEELKPLAGDAAEPIPAHLLKAVIEAWLFAAGEPLPLSQLSDLSAYQPKSLEAFLEAWRQEDENDLTRGVQLRRVKDAYTLSTRASLQDYLKRFYEPEHRPALSAAAYEVLAIVAYNQPVTRAQIEFVRGVNSDAVISRLEERGYIEVCGQLETPGRPALFATTQRFYLEMGIAEASELPPMEMLMYGTLQAFEHEIREEEAEQKSMEEDAFPGEPSP